MPSPAVMRPTSSLTRYKLLPAIGTPQAPRRDEGSLDLLSLRTERLELNNDTIQSREAASVAGGPVRATEHSGGRALYRSVESDYSDERKSKDISREVTMSSDEPDSRLLPTYQGSQEIYSNHGNSAFSPYKLPREPSEEESRILLAVRLLDGSRKQRYFRVTDKLEMVLQFAENCEGRDLSLFGLVRNMPRLVYTDLTVLVGEAELKDRTVLYLEERE